MTKFGFHRLTKLLNTLLVIITFTHPNFSKVTLVRSFTVRPLSFSLVQNYYNPLKSTLTSTSSELSTTTTTPATTATTTSNEPPCAAQQQQIFLHDEQAIKKSVGPAFYDRLEELRYFKSQHNNSTLVPKRYAPNPKLGNWVNKQRQQYRLFQQGKKSSMNAIRIQVLEQEGFAWNTKNVDVSNSFSHINGDTGISPSSSSSAAVLHHPTNQQVRFSTQWDMRFQELKKFKEKFGHCRVPVKYPKLGMWAMHQRHQYHLFQSLQEQQKSISKKIHSSSSSTSTTITSCTITLKRIEALNELGFEWESRWERLWNTRYQELIEYKRIHGHCKVPITYESNPQLANWVSNQRKNYNLLEKGHKSPLTEERLQMLEEIGFVWRVWDAGFF